MSKMLADSVFPDSYGDSGFQTEETGSTNNDCMLCTYDFITSYTLFYVASEVDDCVEFTRNTGLTYYKVSIAELSDLSIGPTETLELNIP